jgi:hypothetical protein
MTNRPSTLLNLINPRSLSHVVPGSFRSHSKWLSQFCAVVSLTIVVYLRSKFVFASFHTPTMLVEFAIISMLLTLIFGIASLPRWQSFVSLTILIAVAYMLFELRIGIP